MVSFTELVLLAGDKVGRKLSDVEEAKVFFRQVTVDTKKSKVEKEFNEDERKRWFTRKALNNWLSRLKNQYRPQKKYKKNVKVKVEGACAEDNDELEESSSDGEESGDSEEEESTFKEGGAPQEEDGDEQEDDNASQEEGGASEEEEGAVEEEGSDQEEDPTNKDGNGEQSESEDVAENSSDDSD